MSYKKIGLVLIVILLLYRWNGINVVDSFSDELDAEVIPDKIILNATVDNNIIKLYWLPPNIGMETFKFYTIIMIKGDDNPQFIFPKNSNCTNCSHIFSNLEYNVKYKFIVLANNKYGVGEFSNIIEITPLDSKKPPKPINDKIIKNINCNPDGTYTLDKFCKNSQPDVTNNYDNFSHGLLMDMLSKKYKELNFDIKFF